VGVGMRKEELVGGSARCSVTFGACFEKTSFAD
jgi:hypothetical protein